MNIDLIDLLKSSIDSIFRSIELSASSWKITPPSRIWTSDLEISDVSFILQSPALPTELSVVVSSMEKYHHVIHIFICTVSVVPIDPVISGGIAQVVSRRFCIQKEPGSIPMHSSFFLRLWLLLPHEQAGGLAQVVERSICIREAPGSIPGFSNFRNLKTKNCVY